MNFYLFDFRRSKYIFFLAAIFLLFLLGKMIFHENISLTAARNLSGWTRLSVYDTPILSRDPGRYENLRLGIATIHNQALIPGQIFSFNQVSGPYEEVLGWRTAKKSMVVGNELQDSIGGGVCQITATLYNAALLADLTVKERHPHNVVSSYVAPGRDSAVWYEGDLNLVFANKHDFPLIIKADIKDKKVVVEIWGRGEKAAQWKSNNQISIRTEKNGELPFEEFTREDSSLEAGKKRVDVQGKCGYKKVSVWRVSQSKEGKKEELISVDSYQPLNQRVSLGSNQSLPVLGHLETIWQKLK